jgi:hypothetical protein
MTFFEARGEGFVATELTRGPWDARLMHGGPPSALLARAFERLVAPAPIARITLEFVRPLVIGELTLQASVVRPGRKIILVAGSLSAGGKEIVRGQALAIRRLEGELALDAARRAPAPDFAAPDALPRWEFPFFQTEIGYHTAMEVRSARGAFGTGAMTAWMRMLVPLLPGEEPSPLTRVLCAADSSNGLSVALDLSRFTFLNPDLTVCLHRMPTGAWIGVDAVTSPEPHGIGLAEGALFDEQAAIGRAAQTLLIEPR